MTFTEQLANNFFRDIFDKVTDRLKNDDTEVVLYRNEFLDPDTVKELAHRFSVKSAFLIDIEHVEPRNKSQDGRSYASNVTLVLYCTYSDYRDEGEGVISSMSLANWAARRLSGVRLNAGVDHSESHFEFGEIMKEDQIPFLSVHALRMILPMTIDFTEPT